MSYNKCRYNDIKYQRSCTSFRRWMMLANSPQESNVALVSRLALLAVPTSTFKIKVEMVHSFAKKRLKAKRVNQTCKSTRRSCKIHFPYARD